MQELRCFSSNALNMESVLGIITLDNLGDDFIFTGTAFMVLSALKNLLSNVSITSGL